MSPEFLDMYFVNLVCELEISRNPAFARRDTDGGGREVPRRRGLLAAIPRFADALGTLPRMAGPSGWIQSLAERRP